MAPRLSVLVSTLNRAEHVAACVKSILANPGQDFELIVVDQSDPETRRRAQAAVGDDPRLRWIGSDTRGLSVSRNLGVAAVRAPLVAFTDDDCRVEPNWIEGVLSLFDRDPSIGLVFGSVLLRPEDRVKGYAAEFEPPTDREFQYALPDVDSRWGVGANMAMRRGVFDRVGLFDPLLGAGAKYHAGEEIDLTLRALVAGYKVLHTPAIAVLHLGIREGAEASRLMRGYGIGLGATLAKHVRLGSPGAARLLTAWLSLHGKRSIRNALRGKKNPGFGLVLAVVWGASRSYEQGINRSRQQYVG